MKRRDFQELAAIRLREATIGDTRVEDAYVYRIR